MSGKPAPPGPGNARVGANVKLLRERLGISQAELGRRLGWSQSTIANIEINHSNVSVDRLSELAKALNVDSCDLLEELS